MKDRRGGGGCKEGKRGKEDSEKSRGWRAYEKH